MLTAPGPEVSDKLAPHIVLFCPLDDDGRLTVALFLPPASSRLDLARFAVPEPGEALESRIDEFTAPGALVAPGDGGTRPSPERAYETYGVPVLPELALKPYARPRSAARDAKELARRFPPPWRESRRRGRWADARDAKPRLRLECAIDRDIRGLTTGQIAEGRSNDTQTPAAEGENHSGTGRRWVREGRKLAAELGLWPWALTRDGVPLDRWWEDWRYAAALATWHYKSTTAALEDALRAAERAGGLRVHGQTLTAHEAALDAYARSHAGPDQEPTGPQLPIDRVSISYVDANGVAVEAPWWAQPAGMARLVVPAGARIVAK